jgi:LmbE family N-acetylglucosaminyl deacetylase
MKLFISPHNDDESLFGAFTLLREKPVVLIVTDSWIQFNRGEEVTADQRWQETQEAMKILGCPVIRGGIRDDVIDEWMVRNLLEKFVGFDEVYAPMVIVNGNPHHNLVGKVAMEVFGDKLKRYVTYAKHSLYMAGEEEVKPTPEEIELKNKAFECYPSQLKINGPHFEAVRGRSEWFI